MEHGVDIWMGIPIDPSHFGSELARLLKAIGRHALIRFSAVNVLRPDGGSFGSDPGAGARPNSLGELIEMSVAIVDRGLLPDIRIGLEFGEAPGTQNGNGFTLKTTLSSDLLLRRRPFGPLPQAWFPTVPPHLVGRSYPLHLRFGREVAGPWCSFRSPGIKRIVEDFWAGIVFDSSPLRFVVLPDSGGEKDWTAEASAILTYYRDPRDLAVSIRLLHGFVTQARDLAETLTSTEFLSAIPSWRKIPSVGSRVPKTGLFLRWLWQPPTPPAHRSLLEPEENTNPDGSRSLMEVLEAALEARGLNAVRNPALAASPSRELPDVMKLEIVNRLKGDP